MSRPQPVEQHPAPDRLEPLVLAEGARACGVDETTLEAAVALALMPDGPDGAVPGWRRSVTR